MIRYIKHILPLAAATLGFGACSDFLSKLPDDRQEIETVQAVQQLMESAYPEYGMYNLAAEVSSDNVQQSPEITSNNTIFDQFFAWEAPTERNNNSTDMTYQGHYMAINTANFALEALAKMNLDTDEARSLRGEALVARAYCHFVLANMFSMAYDPTTADTTLGVPYVTAAERSISFKMTRESLKANYEHIAADLEAGLPLINDSYLAAEPKFRFNKRAAYAFAARFYLYYQQWDKAVAYANLALGSTPHLRDYQAIAALSSDLDAFNLRAIKRQEISARNNLLFLSFRGTQISTYFSAAYPYGMRHNHHDFISGREVLAKAAWWADGQTTNNIKLDPLNASVQKVTFPVFNYQLAPYAGGSVVASTTYAEFTTDETLLVRAEAYIHLGNYEAALRDMNLWLANYTTSYAPLTEASIAAWNTATPYATTLIATPRKQLAPTFALRDTKHEHFAQVLLHMRRIETLHMGLRWFDIKRYGIAFERVNISVNGAISPLGNVLSARDLRQAIQLPQSVITTKDGLQPNPRN